jgi:cytochrome P450
LIGGVGRTLTNEQASTPQALTKSLDDIATGLLINMYFGVVLGSDEFDQLMKYYRRLGPTGFVWFIGPEQKQSFEKIRDFLRFRLASSNNIPKRLALQSVIQRIHDEHHLDEVCLGNLIYMVEMGRFDLYSLFRWLIYYGAKQPEVLCRIAAEDINQSAGKITLSSAFVQETLRMDQSERLMRSVKNDFVFDGYLFPAKAFVRLCIWESHKDQAIFPEPFSFNPD